MKKILNVAAFLSFSLLSANIAMADGMVFDPVDYPQPPKNTSLEAPAAAKAIDETAPTATNANAVNATKENNNLQNALFELDSAQVEIRNNLLEYKSKYTDIDNQYKLIKSERKVMGKQVKTIERKIKDIDRTKEKIRKNMI